MRRTLAAVLVGDVVGYSRLMEKDAEGTLEALRRLRAEVLGPMVAARRGRIVKSMGDGWVVLFSAASDAVECAMQIQNRQADGSRSGDSEILLRIGIQIGDVFEVELETIDLGHLCCFGTCHKDYGEQVGTPVHVQPS